MGKFRTYSGDFLLLTAGCGVLAVGINVFLTPNMIAPGGISSVGTVLLHLFGVRMSVTNLTANAILFILGYRFLGRAAAVKTAAGIVLLTAALELTASLPVYTADPTLAAVIGGVIVGLGVGLAVRRGASTGGSDFAALIAKKFLPRFTVGSLILVIDCAVIVVSGIVFRSFTVTLRSVISLYAAAKVCDAVLGTK